MASKRSFDHDCGITNDLMCAPCSKRGNRAKAVKFCEDCMEYLCSGCVHDHNKFKIMNGHKLLNDVEMRSLRTDPCKFHPRNMIDRYCWYHDAVCCPECISQNHSNCTGVTYLPTAVKRMKISNEYNNTMVSMQDVKLKLNLTKKEQEEELERLEQEKSRAICNIQETTNKMIKHLTDLEKKKIDELCSRYQEQKDKTNENIDVLDAGLTSVEEKIQQIRVETFDGENEQFLFVNAWKDIEESCRKQLKTNEERIKRNIKFQANSKVIEGVLNITSLGDLTEKKNRNEYMVTHHGDYDLMLDYVTVLRDIELFQLDDGTIVVADYANYELAILDSRYKLRDRCLVPGMLYNSCICTIGTNEVAVLLGRKVQCITIGRTKRLSRSFSFGYYIVRGMCYMADQLFVASDENLKVYNKAGTPLRTIHLNMPDGNKIIKRVVGSANNATMYVATYNGQLSSIDSRIDSHYLSSGGAIMKDVRTVCEGPGGQLLVADINNNIFCISSDGLERKMLLTLEKEISFLLYDKINHRLIVTLHRRSTLKVYDMLQI